MPVINLRNGASVEDDPQARIIAAAVRCIARFGVSKTSLDDVAREAGLSRATVYRVVPGGKESLLALVAATELNRFFLTLERALSRVDDLEDMLVAGVFTAATYFEQHGALRFLLEHEPEQILPRFAFQNLDLMLVNVRSFAGPYLEPWLGDDAARTAEWLARIVLSYACTPSPEFALSDEESARRLVRTYVLPGLTLPDRSSTAQSTTSSTVVNK